MKKFGFTLAEILIALSIVGIVSALTAPTIVNIIPDRNKVTLLNLVNTISELNQNLLGNQDIYFVPRDQDGKPTCYGFGCTDKPLTSEFTYWGNSKYISFVEYYLSRDGETSAVASKEFKCTSKTKCHFVSKLGTADDGKPILNTELTITILPDKGSKNCYYSSSCKKSPNQYRLFIDTFGSIKPADPLTEAYMRNPLNMNQRKKDYETAESFKDNTYQGTWDSASGT